MYCASLRKMSLKPLLCRGRLMTDNGSIARPRGKVAFLTGKLFSGATFSSCEVRIIIRDLRALGWPTITSNAWVGL